MIRCILCLPFALLAVVALVIGSDTTVMLAPVAGACLVAALESEPRRID